MFIFPVISRYPLQVNGSSYNTEPNIFFMSHCFGASILQELSNFRFPHIHQPNLPPSIEQQQFVHAMTVLTSFPAGYGALGDTLQQFHSRNSSLMFEFPLRPDPIEYPAFMIEKQGKT